MAISDNQKLDFLFKKLGFGATKTDTNALKAAVNEEIPSPLLLSGNNLWTDAAAIPGTKPTSSTSRTVGRTKRLDQRQGGRTCFITTHH